jgi:hypothetical protein
VIQKRMKTHQESLFNCDGEFATLQERTLDADGEAKRQESQIITARVEASKVATQATPANDSSGNSYTAASIETWNAVMQKTIADNAAAQSKIKECRERAQQEKSTYEVQMQAISTKKKVEEDALKIATVELADLEKREVEILNENGRILFYVLGQQEDTGMSTKRRKLA